MGLIDTHHYIYKINNKDLLYSTGNYIQYLVITYNGKEFEIYTYIYIYKIKKKIYIYIYILCCTPESNTL